MAQKRHQPHRFPTLVDIIDRVLATGVVIEYHSPVSIDGIDTLMTVDAHCVAASFDTYLRYAEPLSRK